MSTPAQKAIHAKKGDKIDWSKVPHRQEKKTSFHKGKSLEEGYNLREDAFKKVKDSMFKR